MTVDLKNRVALVTGASRKIGIGFAIATHLLQAGADVFIQSYAPYDAERPWGADPEGIENILSELRSIGGCVEHLEADFMDEAAPAAVIKAAQAQFGQIDILIANHAYSTMGALEDLTATQIDRHMQVNVRATLLLIKHFAAQYTGNAGRVIMMTSGQHLSAMPDELAYIASKGALHQLTLSLSAHLIKQGITVNTVNPGATDTGYATGELYEAVKNASPQGHRGEPADAARLITWLVSDDAGWITGQVINSTGGGL